MISENHFLISKNSFLISQNLGTDSRIEVLTSRKLFLMSENSVLMSDNSVLMSGNHFLSREMEGVRRETHFLTSAQSILTSGNPFPMSGLQDLDPSRRFSMPHDRETTPRSSFQCAPRLASFVIQHSTFFPLRPPPSFVISSSLPTINYPPSNHPLFCLPLFPEPALIGHVTAKWPNLMAADEWIYWNSAS